ncbi:MAG TPA: 50S ribosomal protein L23 [Thermoprotei archaeon]|nr:50S ribosomal protein L23 [Thermoprotei archaeon]
MAYESVIVSPVSSEEAIAERENNNVLAFYVSRNATKDKVKREVELRFKVKVVKVNIENTFKDKKAYVKLAPEFKATELATNLGLL